MCVVLWNTQSVSYDNNTVEVLLHLDNTSVLLLLENASASLHGIIKILSQTTYKYFERSI